MPIKKNIEKIVFEVDNIIETDFENPLIDKAFSTEFYKALSRVEGVDEYFRLTILADLKRYFTAATEKERDIIRGHITLANHLRSAVVSSRK